MSEVARTQALWHWRVETDAAGIALLAIDKQDSGTNVLSRGVMAELDTILGILESNLPRGLVISAKEDSFIAGADINEFPDIRTAAEASALSHQGQRILARLEGLRCPSLAVINGSALGGGLELALAAGSRLAMPVEKPCLGLPEVQLGLHPGFGGTVRAVRLLGVHKAMDLMLTGRSISMGEALRCGLVDAMTTRDTWREDAVRALLAPIL